MEAIIVALAAMASAVTTASISALVSRRHRTAEAQEHEATAASTVAAASVALLEPIMAQLELAQRQHLELRAQVELLRRQVDHLEVGIDALSSQLRAHGLEPAWIVSPV